ncbi:MAG: dihydrolipoamide acetyltransferase family protein, partial [Candidatus Eisenbacteria bacterium]
LKQVGDKIERDEPLFEISTDKVDSVIPAPAGGYLTAIKVPEGTTVNINTVVAVIDASPSGAASPTPADVPAETPVVAPAPPSPAEAPSSLPRDTSPLGLDVKEIVMPASLRPAASAAPAKAGGGNGPAAAASGPALLHPTTGRVLTSPLVKTMARVENVDLHTVPGTGAGGGVTRLDVARYLEDRKRGGSTAPGAPAAAAGFGLPAPSPSWLAQVMPGDRVEPMSKMRSIIANHMVFSKHTSPHVYTVFEFDLTRIAAIRAKEKVAFEQAAGVKLTFMPFILRATVHALRKNPVLNSSVRGNEIIYHASSNVGIAVDLNPGLIVPVVKQAEEKSFLGLARSLADLAARARSKQLSPDDVQGGTFTITNPGGFGSLFGCPVINQPQVAILDVGGIVKRPVVLTDDEGDKIAIRSICLISVAYDHRVVDGASADHFMNDVRDYLEGWNEPLV